MTSASAATCDSSVLFPYLHADHPLHDEVWHGMSGHEVASVSAHVYLETYSVMTRLPAPLRLPASIVERLLGDLQWEVLAPAAADHPRLVSRLAAGGIGGGATYDGLIGATAAAHELTLITADARARRTYEAVGAQVELIG